MNFPDNGGEWCQREAVGDAFGVKLRDVKTDVTLLKEVKGKVCQRTKFYFFQNFVMLPVRQFYNHCVFKRMIILRHWL